MVTNDARTDNDALIEVAQDAVKVQEVDPTKLMLARQGYLVLDGENHLPTPRRKKGTIQVYDAKSLEEYFARQLLSLDKTNPTMLYADREKALVVAVFNDHAASPGWRDHRAELHLRPTPAWKHWSGKDGKLGTQVEFAEHVEQGLSEIVEPVAAEVLELAQTFEANQRVAFKSATTLADGARQLTYAQTIEAKAGQTGQLTIPKELSLVLRPYEGSALFPLIARLRYRIESEVLRIGYVLVRPYEVLDAAFDNVIEAVENGTSLVALRGAP